MQTPALKLFSDENAHMMLWRENLPAAYELLEPGGWPTISDDGAVKKNWSKPRISRAATIGVVS